MKALGYFLMFLMAWHILNEDRGPMGFDLRCGEYRGGVGCAAFRAVPDFDAGPVEKRADYQREAYGPPRPLYREYRP